MDLKRNKKSRKPNVKTGEVVSTRGTVAVLFDACVGENSALVGFFEGQSARIWSEKTSEVTLI